MKLKSMKVTKAEREKRMEPSTIATDGPSYPWGLQLNLDDATIEKLGLKVADATVGDEMTVLAKVKVCSVSSSQGEYGKNQSMSLQITEMGIEAGKSTKEVADKLYSSKE